MSGGKHRAGGPPPPANEVIDVEPVHVITEVPPPRYYEPQYEPRPDPIPSPTPTWWMLHGNAFLGGFLVAFLFMGCVLVYVIASGDTSCL